MNPAHRKTSEMFAVAAGVPAFGLKRLLDRLLRLLTDTDTTLVEFLSSSSLIYVGLILAMPNDALSVPAPLFAVMTRFATEGQWAAFFLASGVFQSAANLSRVTPLRRGASFAACGVFLVVGGLGASVHPVSLFGALCKVQALGQALVFLQIGEQERKRVREEERGGK